MSIFEAELMLKRDLEAMRPNNAVPPPRPSLRDATTVNVANSCILSDAVIARLALAMPKSYARIWRQLYSTREHGFSLSSLYQQAAGNGATVVAVLTTRGDVVGALLSDGIREPESGQFYYGTGESFVFKACSGDCGDDAGTGSSSSRREGADDSVQIFPWTGENFLFCYSSPQSISIGGGNGAAGLYLEETLLRGSTGPTETFSNSALCPPQDVAGELTDPEIERFEIAHLEIWGVDPVALKAARKEAMGVELMPRPSSVNVNMSTLLLDGF
jgi:hypothetical protein